MSRAVSRTVGIAVASVTASFPMTASAHEKWFFDARDYPLRWDLFFTPLPFGFAAGAIALTVIAFIVARRRDERDFFPSAAILGATPDRIRRFAGFLPLIVGVHTAVALLVDGTHTRYLAPSGALTGFAAYAIGIGETFVALAFFYGAFTRVAAIMLALIWFAGFFVVGPEVALENVMFLGIAGFFFCAGRGPLSVDRMLFPRLEPPPHLVRIAIRPLRIGLGASLAIVAFTEKFANLPLALAFLHKYPLNFTHFLGVPLPDTIFVLSAATVELLIGLWIALGIFPRTIIILAWFPFNLTLSVFNATELIGHLPIYGIMALLLLLPSSRRDGETLTATLAA